MMRYKEKRSQTVHTKIFKYTLAEVTKEHGEARTQDHTITNLLQQRAMNLSALAPAFLHPCPV